MVADSGATPRKPLERRRKQRFTDGRSAVWPNLHNCPPSADFRRRTAFAVSRIVLSRTGRATAFAVPHMDCDTAMAARVAGANSWRRENGRMCLLETAVATMVATAGGVESNKGVSEGLSALGGKSIRVRRESPSKTPKNRFQKVPWPIRPRRRNWRGVR